MVKKRARVSRSVVASCLSLRLGIKCSNVVSIAWNTFLALVAGGGGSQEQKSDAVELPSMGSGSSPSRNINALQHELREIKTDKQH